MRNEPNFQVMQEVFGSRKMSLGRSVTVAFNLHRIRDLGDFKQFGFDFLMGN